MIVLEQAEQMNQAIKGIKQALKLAKDLGKTFVVPFVGSSKIRPPHYHPAKRRSMSYYFDMEYVKRVYYDKIVEYDDFLEHAENITILPVILEHKRTSKTRFSRAENTLAKSFTQRSIQLEKPMLFSFKKNRDSTHYDSLKAILEKHDEKSIAFVPFDRYLWHDGDVPEFEPSYLIKSEVERFKTLNNLNTCYISIQWRFERTNIKEARQILSNIIRTVDNIRRTHIDCKLYFGSDLSFYYGSMTLNTYEYEKYKPISDKLFQLLGEKPIEYNPQESPIASILDSGTVGIIEQQIHADSTFFIPAMVRSGYVKTILRKRESLGRKSELILDIDKRIWTKELESFKKNGWYSL